MSGRGPNAVPAGFIEVEQTTTVYRYPDGGMARSNSLGRQSSGRVDSLVRNSSFGRLNPPPMPPAVDPARVSRAYGQPYPQFQGYFPQATPQYPQYGGFNPTQQYYSGYPQQQQHYYGGYPQQTGYGHPPQQYYGGYPQQQPQYQYGHQGSYNTAAHGSGKTVAFQSDEVKKAWYIPEEDPVNASDDYCLTTIGMNYDGEKSGKGIELANCRNDSRLMAGLFRSICGLRSVNTIVLNSQRAQEDATLYPTRDNTVASMRSFVQKVNKGPKDGFGVFHFSCHGFQEVAKSGNAVGEKDGKNEVILTAERGKITDDEFVNFVVKPLESDKTAFFNMDHCHAGHDLEHNYYVDQRGQVQYVQNEDFHLDNPAHVVISATSLDDQTSADGIQAGAGTKALEHALTKYPLGEITLRQYLTEGHKYLRQHGYKQNLNILTTVKLGLDDRLLPEHVGRKLMERVSQAAA